MDNLCTPKGRYPEVFMLISLFEVCQEGGGSRRRYLEDFCGFLTKDMEDRVIPDVMNDVVLPQGKYPENFVLIYQLEVCQEGGYLEDAGGS